MAQPGNASQRSLCLVVAVERLCGGIFFMQVVALLQVFSLYCLPIGELDTLPGQRERATAILLACRHLPLSFLSSPGQRAVLLAEAARTLEKVGDKRSCNDCQQMIVKLSGGTAIAAS